MICIIRGKQTQQNQDVYHVPCFRCEVCEKTLSLTNYHAGRMGSVLCLKHFSEEKSGSVAVLSTTSSSTYSTSTIPSADKDKAIAKSDPILSARQTERIVESVRREEGL